MGAGPDEMARYRAVMRSATIKQNMTNAGVPEVQQVWCHEIGAARMFHAVSLEGDAEAAKVLAFSTPQMADGVRRLEDARLELTAVVEPLKSVTDDVESEAGERYRFGVETMERQRIRVLTIHDVARAALTAQRELGL